MSSTLGSSTSTGWKRRSSAGSFSMCWRYSSSVVAPIARSSPRASIGFSMLPASIAPSAAPAPTIVCSSSMNVMISPSESAISFNTALSRSSNSPRYFAPATIAPRSSAISRLSCSDVGTSPSTMRWASPSTIAVLPTPGSPISTGLFFVRRESTWIVRRISSSRPITGSSLPVRAASVRSRPYRLERLERVLGVRTGDALTAAHLRERRERRVTREPGLEQDARGFRARRRQHREQQVLGRDVLVGERLRLGARGLEQLRRGRRDPHLDTLRVDLRHRVERLVDLGPQLRRVRPDVVQQREDDPFGVGEQREQHVLGFDQLVVAHGRLLVCFLQGGLRLHRELVQVHARVPFLVVPPREAVHRVVVGTVGLGHERAQHALEREAEPLGHAPHRGVLDVGRELHPVRALVVEEMPSRSQPPRRHPGLARGRRPRRPRCRARRRRAAEPLTGCRACTSPTSRPVVLDREDDHALR